MRVTAVPLSKPSIIFRKPFPKSFTKSLDKEMSANYPHSWFSAGGGFGELRFIRPFPTESLFHFRHFVVVRAPAVFILVIFGTATMHRHTESVQENFSSGSRSGSEWRDIFATMTGSVRQPNVAQESSPAKKSPRRALRRHHRLAACFRAWSAGRKNKPLANFSSPGTTRRLFNRADRALIFSVAFWEVIDGFGVFKGDHPWRM